MHFASSEGHTDIVELLLDNNAEIDPLDDWCTTPLVVAIKGSHLDTANLLLKKNANANIQLDDNRRMLLHWAAEGGHAETAKLLIQYVKEIDPCSR